VKQILNSILLVIGLSGCFTPAGMPTTDDQNEQAFRMLAETFVTNYHNRDSDVKVAALPYTEQVIRALGIRETKRNKWTSTEEAGFVHTLMEDHIGSNNDSLSFILFLTNRTYPCKPILVQFGSQPVHELIPGSMMPCLEVPIADIHQRIYLQNERGVKIRPIVVWGRHNETLTTDETLIVKFQVGLNSYSWMRSSKHVDLCVDLKSGNIALPIKE